MEKEIATTREPAECKNAGKRGKKTKGNLFVRFLPLYLMLLPLVVYLFIFNYYPMFGLQIAFKDWFVRKGIWGSPWATTDGKLDLFKYFSQLFGTSLFKEKLINTLRISLLKMLFGFPAPILLVLMLNELPSARFAKLTQSVSYIPHFLSWVVLGGIFLSLDKSTAFQDVMLKLFGRNIHFFSNDNLYVGFLIFSDIYKEAGWGTIIYLATLMNIDPQLYEAASLDGAGRFKKILYITLPGLLPAISFNAILTLSNIMYAGFDQIYNTYNSVLSGKGETLEMYLFSLGITGGNYSLSTAIGLFNSAIGCVLVILTNKLTKLIGGEGIW
ncbi:MAG: sugar ABC transporter permease [Firmicutes bacterium]|nr:sugar ABC transporter permease [Bacillota bacterium]